MLFDAFPRLVSDRALVARGILVLFFLYVLTLLYRLFGSVFCAAFVLLFGAFLPLAITITLVTWCFLVLFSDFTSKHADTTFY